MSEELENYPAYVAFGVEKLQRIKQLDPIMRTIHECCSDVLYVYRRSRSAKEYTERLKVHNENNRAMIARNRDAIEEYNGLQAEWREFWAKWNTPEGRER